MGLYLSDPDSETDRNERLRVFKFLPTYLELLGPNHGNEPCLANWLCGPIVGSLWPAHPTCLPEASRSLYRSHVLAR